MFRQPSKEMFSPRVRTFLVKYEHLQRKIIFIRKKISKTFFWTRRTQCRRPCRENFNQYPGFFSQCTIGMRKNFHLRRKKAFSPKVLPYIWSVVLATLLRFFAKIPQKLEQILKIKNIFTSPQRNPFLLTILTCTRRMHF